MKRRNPRLGCVRIAQQVSHVFGIAIYKDVVRRVLAKHYRPGDTGSDGPSWLTFIAQTKDSLWSVDLLFRCESILLRSHWVLLVMDLCKRRLVGFDVERASIDGVSVCRMLNHAIAGQVLPKHVSTDHDRLFRFHRWLTNLRVLAIEEVKSVPSALVSHPFIERFIGTIRREHLDRASFRNAMDLTRKLAQFQDYYNANRVDRSLAGDAPAQRAGEPFPAPAALDRYVWRPHCRGLLQSPIAA
jgi:transposase InsO family protein